MVRSAASKVMWVGRATVFLVGLAVILALVFGAATTAFGADGDFFKVGRANIASAVSTLTKSGTGPALSLKVDRGAPLAVNSATKVAKLNADKLDGKDFGAFGVSETGVRGGPLPLQHTFTTNGGTLIVWASGSGFRAAGNTQLEGNIGMNVFVDGTFWTKVGVFTNERDSHKAFVSRAFPVRGFPAGTHTIRLEEAYDTGCNTTNETRSLHFCTTTNDDDRFQVTVMEIPD